MGNRRTTLDQTASYRSALLAERARVMSGGRNDLEILAVPGATSEDDQASVMHDQFIALHRRGLDLHKLKLIDAALERLEGGQFGTCDECGEPIPAKRLRAVPWAAFCLTCQDRTDTLNGDDGNSEPWP